MSYNPFPPFSVDATPTSYGNSSGPLGGALPPPDITGYTYGDYATPNYNVAAGAPTPNIVVDPNNPVNAPAAPSSATESWIGYAFIGGLVVGLIWFGATYDKRKKRKN